MPSGDVGLYLLKQEIKLRCMMKNNILALCFLAAGLFASPVSNAQTATVFTVKADEVKGTIQSTMWGLFFEDINMGADGGIYAELVKNGSFEFYTPMMGWKEQKQQEGGGKLLMQNQEAVNPVNRHYIQLEPASAQGNYCISNEGFRGIGIKKGSQYNFSVLARQHKGSDLTLVVEVVNPEGKTIGTATVAPQSPQWRPYKVSFTATDTAPKAQLNVWAKGKGTIDLDLISLFPADTWKNRPRGLRADMVQLLADMKPGFQRFPGGCIVEGRTLDERFQWKKTIGPIENRELIVNRWNTEFKHRPTSDYYQSFGLGFFEYLQLAEDLGSEPLPILNCGMACQFNTGEVVPLDQLDTYIQDALDLIEFANGPATST